MTPDVGRQLVVSGMATTAVLVVGRSAVESESLPTMRAVAGLGLAFVGLSVLADVAPEVAGPLAVLVAISALVVPYRGQSSAQVILAALGAAPGGSEVSGPNPPAAAAGAAGPGKVAAAR